MQNNNPEPIHKPLPGAVCRQWVRCGNPTCHCARGQRHGPYYYRFWREGGKLRKQYVRPADLEEVRARCEARRQAKRDLQAAWGTWRELLAQLREVEQP
jgi:hypothetical protein